MPPQLQPFATCGGASTHVAIAAAARMSVSLPLSGSSDPGTAPATRRLLIDPSCLVLSSDGYGNADGLQEPSYGVPCLLHNDGAVGTVLVSSLTCSHDVQAHDDDVPEVRATMFSARHEHRRCCAALNSDRQLGCFGVGGAAAHARTVAAPAPVHHAACRPFHLQIALQHQLPALYRAAALHVVASVHDSLPDAVARPPAVLEQASAGLAHSGMPLPSHQALVSCAAFTLCHLCSLLPRWHTCTRWRRRCRMDASAPALSQSPLPRTSRLVGVSPLPQARATTAQAQSACTS